MRSDYYPEDQIMFKVLSVRTQKARKEHKCWTCGQTIGVGEKYYVIVALADGEFEWIKCHYEFRDDDYYGCYPLA